MVVGGVVSAGVAAGAGVVAGSGFVVGAGGATVLIGARGAGFVGVLSKNSSARAVLK